MQRLLSGARTLKCPHTFDVWLLLEQVHCVVCVCVCVCCCGVSVMREQHEHSTQHSSVHATRHVSAAWCPHYTSTDVPECQRMMCDTLKIKFNTRHKLFWAM